MYRVLDPAIQAKIDDIEAKLDHAAHGLAALRLLILAIPLTPELEADALIRYNVLVALISALETEADALVRYNTLLADILAIPLTPELEADALVRYNTLLADILAIPLTPELEADALVRYNIIIGYIDDLETRLTAARAGYLDNINNAQLLNISAAILARIDVAISSRLATASYTAERGTDNAMLAANGALEATVTAIKTQTDKIPRGVYSMSFWSDNDDDITLTTTATDDFALPSIAVAGLPVGITLVRVVAMLKIALIKTTSGADNAINGATALKVDANPTYGSLVTAIDIPDNSWAVDVSEATERGGDVMIGDNDVKAEVTVNATYYARLENISCDGNNLILKDVAWGLRVYFTV